jgi:Fic family protein
MRRLFFGAFMYIYENKEWPNFVWEQNKFLNLLAKVKLSQGFLLGKMSALGFQTQNSAILSIMTEEILKSNKIEGEILNIEQVRSSIARKLGIAINNNKIKSSRSIDGIVEVMYDAAHNYEYDMTKKRLCIWHAKMFPKGKSGFYKIKTGQYRDDKLDQMQVVSGPLGMEKVHYGAPPANVLDAETDKFINFINAKNDGIDLIIKAAIAQLWFVILHPFDDGNGRIARALTEFLLAKSENSQNRFYSMSYQIEKERKSYYEILEKTQKGSLDITAWIIWFLNAQLYAIENSTALLKAALLKYDFWKEREGLSLNERQSKTINMLLDGFNGNLTSTKWAKINKVSHDTATRDIAELMRLKIFVQEGAGRNTHYKIKMK